MYANTILLITSHLNLWFSMIDDIKDRDVKTCFCLHKLHISMLKINCAMSLCIVLVPIDLSHKETITFGECNMLDRLNFNPIPNSLRGRNTDNCSYASRGFHTRVILITPSNFGVCAQVKIHANSFPDFTNSTPAIYIINKSSSPFFL